MDEVVSLKDRVEELSEENGRLQEALRLSLDMGRTLREDLEREREEHRRLLQQYQETRMLVDGLVGLVGKLRDNLMRFRVQEGRACRRAETPILQELVDFGSCLVPIGEPDRAESWTGSLPSSSGLSREVEVIDLTDDGSNDVFDDVFDDVPDYMGEERRQAEEAVE